MSTTTLYQLIKKTSQEKGRKLKLIVDWDEVIQPLKPAAIYEKMPDSSMSFKEFFKDFWSNVEFSGSPSGGSRPRIGGDKGIKSYSKTYKGDKRVKAAIEEYEKEKVWGKNVQYKWDAYAKHFYGRPERFKSPFLTTADDLLKCLEEDLIEEIATISSYNIGKPGVIAGIGKIQKIMSTLGQFPNVKIEYTPMEKKGKVEGKMVASPLRQEVIKEKYSDFDIFIDDSTKAISGTRKIFPDRIYGLPDYKYSRKVSGNNIYYIEVAISDLKDEDFVKAAEEYKQKQQTKNSLRTSSLGRERERERESIWKQPIFYWGLVGGFAAASLIFFGSYLFRKKTRWKENNKHYKKKT